MAQSSKVWFAARTYGYGAGPPVRWEGWAALFVLVAGIGAAGVLLDGVTRIAAMVFVLFAFIAVASPRTEGGWRWRWGKDR